MRREHDYSDERLTDLLKCWEVPELSASLDERVIEAAYRRIRPQPLWQRLIRARVAVPLPVAAAAAVVLCASALVAVRSATEAPDGIAPPLPAAPRVIEVPVVHERVNTRVVYVNRAPRPGEAARSVGASLALMDVGAEKLSITETSLRGFEPVNEIKLRVIKKERENEKN